MPVYMYSPLALVSRSSKGVDQEDEKKTIFLPGEPIFTSSTNLITGHGTYRSDVLSGFKNTAEAFQELNTNENVQIKHSMYSSLGGHVQTVNKLVYVEPIKARYSGNVGDTVVGKILEVDQRRWLVDINSYQSSILQLANVKLPGGELRRKSEDDERAMRSFMKEGDIIVAEIHDIFKDGNLQLHMPGIRTGRLGEGCFISIPPSSIKKQKLHRHQLNVPKGSGFTESGSLHSDIIDHIQVGVILGCNGYIWIGPTRGMALGLGTGAALGQNEHISQEDLKAEYIAISRVRNCILILSDEGLPVWETSIIASAEASWLDEKISFSENNVIPENGITSRLLRPDVRKRIAELVRRKLETTD